MNINFLFSRIGLLVTSIGLVICVLVISSLPSVRIDLTQDDLYSLSPGTKNIVSDLQGPLEIMFFYSESATEDTPQIRTYANRVQELLREIIRHLIDYLTKKYKEEDNDNESKDKESEVPKKEINNDRYN